MVDQSYNLLPKQDYSLISQTRQLDCRRGVTGVPKRQPI